MGPSHADASSAAASARPTGSRGRHILARIAEYLLILIAVFALGYYAYSMAESMLYQAFENRELDALLAPVPASAARAPAAPASVPAPGSLLGRLEIPRLSVSAVIRAGSDARTLQLAIGHIPGTPAPGQPGNVGLAAHRDTFFRRLGDLRLDDEIRLVTPQGTLVYRVEHTDIVQPRDVWVLDATSSDVLTLITCYPFTYVGAAPERFVVRAVRDQPPARAAR